MRLWALLPRPLLRAGACAAAGSLRCAGNFDVCCGPGIECCETHCCPEGTHRCWAEDPFCAGADRQCCGNGSCPIDKACCFVVDNSTNCCDQGEVCTEEWVLSPRKTRAAARAGTPVQRGRSVPPNAGAALMGQPAAPTVSAVIVAGRVSSAQRGTNAGCYSSSGYATGQCCPQREACCDNGNTCCPAG